MLQNAKEFSIGILRDYAKRFWQFWIILYVAAVLAGIVKYVLPTLLPFLKYWGFPIPLFLASLRSDFLAHPYYFLLIPLPFIITLWGGASLYFSFSGLSVLASFKEGFKNLHRYTAFVLVATLLTLIGFLILTVPLLLILNNGSFNVFTLVGSSANALGYNVLIPLLAIAAIPGIYLLVSFAIAPFILLFEKRNIFQALRESHRRIKSKWLYTFLILSATLLVMAVPRLWVFPWLLVHVRLLLASVFHQQTGLFLEILLNPIFQVLVTGFFDLVVYHLYLRLSSSIPQEVSPVIRTPHFWRSYFAGKNVSHEAGNVLSHTSPPPKAETPLLSKSRMSIIAAFLLIAMIMSFVGVPSPAHATGLEAVFIAAAAAIAAFLSVDVFLVYLAYFLIVDVVGQGLFTLATSSCGFNGCTADTSSFTQAVMNGLDVKFNNIKFDLPTHEQYAANPGLKINTTVDWKSAAPDGIREYIVASNGDQEVRTSSGPRRMTCTGMNRTYAYCRNNPDGSRGWVDPHPQICDSAGETAGTLSANNQACRDFCKPSSVYTIPANPDDIFERCAEDPETRPAYCHNIYSDNGNGLFLWMQDNVTPQNATNGLALDFNKTYDVEIRYETCLQLGGGINTFHSVALCVDPNSDIGCGCDPRIKNSCGVLTKTQIKTPKSPAETGVVEIKEYLDGVERTDLFKIDYVTPDGSGSAKEIAPITFDYSNPGDYTASYKPGYGGPGFFENITVTTGPCNGSCTGSSVTKHLNAGEKIRFNFNFVSQQQQTGRLHLRSNLPDGTGFSAMYRNQSYPITTPTDIDSAPANQNYTVSSVAPPQGYNFQRVDYSTNPPILTPGGDITLTFNFIPIQAALPSCTISFNPSSGPPGSPTTFSWDSQNDADGTLPISCTGSIGQNIIPSPHDSYLAPIPHDSQTCTVIAQNSAGVSSPCYATINATTQQQGKIAVKVFNNNTNWGDGSTSKINLLLSVNGNTPVPYNDIPVPFQPTDAPPGRYKLTWVSGGPGGSPSNPIIQQDIRSGETTTFVYYFGSVAPPPPPPVAPPPPPQANGTIHLRAKNNSIDWEGILHLTYNGNTIPITVPSDSPAPPGTYTTSYVSGGPGGIPTISPSASQILNSGGNITFSFIFGSPVSPPPPPPVPLSPPPPISPPPPPPQNRILYWRAIHNGTDWTGKLTATVNGVTKEIAVPSQQTVPLGTYNVSYGSGGPEPFQYIAPGTSQTVTGSQDITFSFIFRDPITEGYIITAFPYCSSAGTSNIIIDSTGVGCGIELYKCQGAGCTPGGSFIYTGTGNTQRYDKNVTNGVTYGYQAVSSNSKYCQKSIPPSNTAYATAPNCSPSPLSAVPLYQQVRPNTPVSCTAQGGSSAYTWSAPGGNPSSGNQSTFTTSYPTTGLKTMTVSSAGQQSSCSVDVKAPMSVSCFVSPTSASIGQEVTWTAEASGGATPYSYSWSGSDGLSGTSQSTQKSYSTTGTKTGRITVSSGGQTIQQNCTNQLTVGSVPLPAVSIRANGATSEITIPRDTSATISWSSTNADSCSVFLTSWTGLSGSESTGSLSSPRTYTVSCVGPGGVAASSVTVRIQSTCETRFIPNRIYLGDTTTLSASSCGVGTYTCDGNLGTSPFAGSKTDLRPDKTQRCQVNGANGSAAATIRVIGPEPFINE